MFGGGAAKLQPYDPAGAWRSNRAIAESVAASALRESASQSVVRGRSEQTLIILVTHSKRRATWINPAGIIGLFFIVSKIRSREFLFYAADRTIGRRCTEN